MAGNGYVGTRGTSLSIKFDNKCWHIIIQSVYNESCGDFMQYNGRNITRFDVEKFIPNWSSLKWHPSNLFGSKGISARDKNFDVKLLTKEDSSLSNKQILEEFTEFMSKN